MDKLSLEERVTLIEERNIKVEIDKAWETSYTRRILLAIFTYLAIALYLYFFVHIDPWLNAIVPSIAFLLSTFTLPMFKDFWKKYIYKNKS